MAYKQPDKNRILRAVRGRFVPETLNDNSLELERSLQKRPADHFFQRKVDQLLKQYVGRETPLYYAKSNKEVCRVEAKIFLKEDLNTQNT